MKRQPPSARVPPFRGGCAGWSLPSRDAAGFGEGASALQRYATRFELVEINSSFYRPHKPDTYARWAQSVPDGFVSLRLPKSSHLAQHRANIDLGRVPLFADGRHRLFQVARRMASVSRAPSV